MKHLISMMISAYQCLLSPVFGPCCRFYPSCSEFCREAIMRHGLMRGGYLTMRRLLRCHPWHPGGVDPVPDNINL
ncbi:MAG: membrane protein insertion efficiency factor YidD [Kiritimatiellia bacterium]